MTARTPTSAPGSSARLATAGFTLVELLVVLLLIALVSGLVGLSLRDGSEAQLEREAQRLGALLESARAESRALGVVVRFELTSDETRNLGNGPGGEPEDFRFVGLPAEDAPPGRWLDAAVRARIDGARALRLGPEPLIGAQRITLALGERQLVLATDGLSPFTVTDPALAATP